MGKGETKTGKDRKKVWVMVVGHGADRVLEYGFLLSPLNQIVFSRACDSKACLELLEKLFLEDTKLFANYNGIRVVLSRVGK